GRDDLAHVQPAELVPDTVGKGVDREGLPPDGRPDVAAVVQRVASNGYVRNKLTVFQGGAGPKPTVAAAAGTATTATGIATVEVAAAAAEGVVEVINNRLEQIRAARMKGYEGDSCAECGNFTLVRNGTCLKCDICGSTSGCS